MGHLPSSLGQDGWILASSFFYFFISFFLGGGGGGGKGERVYGETRRSLAGHTGSPERLR